MSVWDALSGLADDVVDVAEDVADGLADAAASLFEGAAPLAGILTSGGALFIAGPAFLVPAYVAGAGTAAALIRHRPMELEERSFAERVYGNALPPNERIVLTNLSGLGGAKFSCQTLPSGCFRDAPVLCRARERRAAPLFGPGGSVPAQNHR